ncbi:MAG: 16S rRNA (guanine(527)-N(7))-methyltransferase RsmG [Bacteroidota bacterium]
MPAEGLELIIQYFPDLSPKQKEQFAELAPLYTHWNARINVISRKDIEQLYVRHVLHSLSIARFFTFQPGAYVLDIGTGGGFPGVPLAILYPETSFLLVDSIGKKIKVVTEVANALSLTNVEAKHQRAEIARGPFDYVVTRAVARAAKLYNWCHRQVKRDERQNRPNGLICLKGGDLTEELAELGRPHEIMELRSAFKMEFFDTKKLVFIPVQ